MEFTNSTVTMVYNHTYAGEISMTLPVYTVALNKKGSYFNQAEVVSVSGTGSESINAIGFATDECTRSMELYPVTSKESIVNVHIHG